MPRKTRSARPPGEVLVLDTGAANVHISCSEEHRDDVCTMPNAIARTRQGVRRQVLVGDCIETECQDYGELQLRLPMDRGMVVDWAAQKSVWDRALTRTLGCGSDTFGALHGRSVIMTEPYFALPEQQKAFDMLMFEWYEAESIWRTIPAQLVPWSLTPPRPEVVLVVDIGHSYTHAVPIVKNKVMWDAVRRLDIGGKVLTSLLKVMFSYRQWDMMDETYLTDKMKMASCFVAACARDNDRRRKPLRGISPSNWSFEQLVELFHDGDNDLDADALIQHYVLPDYATPEDVADPNTKYGYVQAGPRLPVTTTTSTPVLPEDQLDSFVADLHPPTKEQRGKFTVQTDHQVLCLGQERYQLFETFFAPDRIGLNQAPLPELIASSIQLVQETDLRNMLWSHIVLIGGSARVPGLRRRLQHELRMLAPDDVSVGVHVFEDPIEAPARGALALWKESTTSSEARSFLAAHTVSRDAWLQAGGSQASPGERGGTALCDERFDGWNAPRPSVVDDN